VLGCLYTKIHTKESTVLLATNISYRIVPHTELTNQDYQEKLVNFLFTSLEQYSDPIPDIQACLKYIMDESKGGNVFVAEDEHSNLYGAVFLTRTGMEGFVPGYLLVYIATHKDARGKGIGYGLLSFVKDNTKAAIALHVEHDNPAKRLYEKVGFTNKYTEMRWYP